MLVGVIALNEFDKSVNQANKFGVDECGSKCIKLSLDILIGPSNYQKG